MRIGVVSDTHNNLRNVARIVELFNDARVERVVHTGDVTQPKVLDAFAALTCPLVGVFGNNDERRALRAAAESLGFEFSEAPLELEWHGRSIVVVHDPRELDGIDRQRYAVALHGHTHRRVVDREDGCLVFNPGECAGHVTGGNAVGVLDLASLEVELLTF
jgi:putative phosphoesterase